MSASVSVRAMRNFRLRHGISLKELSEATGKSVQWINLIELGGTSASIHNQYHIMLAFQNVIDNRKRLLTQLEADYQCMKRSFFEEVPEWTCP